MKQFKFEITLTDQDLMGDEFWEEALKRDGTGIAELTETIEQMIEDSNLIVSSDKTPKDVIKLISYTEV
jgi:predicted methyltransferase MtxX (methanogen marker protein 4)